MKTQQMTRLIFKSLYLLTFLCFTITFMACSDDSDDSDVNADQSCENILECQSGTIWKLDNPIVDYYISINNNKSNPWTAYIEMGGCFEKMNANEIGAINITDLGTALLIYKDEWEDTVEITTVSYSNDQITIKVEYFEAGTLDETETMTFKKSTMKVSDLEIC